MRVIRRGGARPPTAFRERSFLEDPEVRAYFRARDGGMDPPPPRRHLVMTVDGPRDVEDLNAEERQELRAAIDVLRLSADEKGPHQ